MAISLLDLRKARGLSQEAAGAELGLSKSYLSKLEAGVERPSLRLALQIEAWSGGELPAEELVSAEDARLLAEHRRLASATTAEVAA